MNLLRRLHDFFLPNARNGYHPHVFRDRVVAFLVGGIVSTFIVAALAALPSVRANLAAVYPKVLVALANDDRDALDLPPLATNPLLERAAQLKANDMVTNGYFAHESPSGVSPWHWFSEAGYPYLYAGENLAVNFADSEDVNDAWLRSPTHRANIMGPHYTEIGVATAEGIYQGRRAIFVVQEFGSQKPGATVATAPAPASRAASRRAVAAAPAPATSTRPTTTAVLGAELAPTSTVAAGYAEPSLLERVAASPGHALRWVYVALGLFVSLALVLLVLVEIRHQRPRGILYGLLLLVIIASLYTAYQAAVATDVIVAGGDLSLSATTTGR